MSFIREDFNGIEMPKKSITYDALTYINLITALESHNFKNKKKTKIFIEFIEGYIPYAQDPKPFRGLLKFIHQGEKNQYQLELDEKKSRSTKIKESIFKFFTWIYQTIKSIFSLCRHSEFKSEGIHSKEASEFDQSNISPTNTEKTYSSNSSKLILKSAKLKEEIIDLNASQPLKHTNLFSSEIKKPNDTFQNYGKKMTL